MAPRVPPTIDFGPFFGSDTAAKEALIQQLRAACQDYGFFQLTNHGIPAALQDAIIEKSKELFSLPLDVKEKYSKDIGGFNRGYERLRAQNFEKRTEGDLKEGYYFGRHLELDHPYVKAKKFNQGPNKYPEDVNDPQAFRETVDEYIDALTGLAENLLRALAKTLNMEEEWFEDFLDTPIAIMRLLHYPPQEPDASALERGIGAHTDFGAVTILLQDMVGGLQVWDRESSEWVDITPVPGAFVVNLGNMMMRWTNDKYLSNLHRVINKSGQERYSVPFFFSGNPDFLVKCLPTCEGEGAKYPPVTVSDWMAGRYADTYGTSKEKAMGELSTNDAAAATV